MYKHTIYRHRPLLAIGFGCVVENPYYINKNNNYTVSEDGTCTTSFSTCTTGFSTCTTSFSTCTTGFSTCTTGCGTVLQMAVIRVEMLKRGLNSVNKGKNA